MVEIRCLPIACSLMARLWHFSQHGWYHYEAYWSLRKISICSLTFSFPMLKVPYCAINHPRVFPCQPLCWTFILGVPTSPTFTRLMKKVLVSNSQLRLKNRSTKSQTHQLHLFFFSCSKFIKVQSHPPVFPMKYSFQQSRESLPCVQWRQGAPEPNQ